MMRETCSIKLAIKPFQDDNTSKSTLDSPVSYASTPQEAYSTPFFQVDVYKHLIKKQDHSVKSDNLEKQDHP
jgi:hypothetical protein